MAYVVGNVDKAVYVIKDSKDTEALIRVRIPQMSNQELGLSPAEARQLGIMLLKAAETPFQNKMIGG